MYLTLWWKAEGCCRGAMASCHEEYARSSRYTTGNESQIDRQMNKIDRLDRFYGLDRLDRFDRFDRLDKIRQIR